MMDTWNGALFIILALVAFGLVAARVLHLKAKRRGEEAWERLVRHRFGDDEQP